MSDAICIEPDLLGDPAGPRRRLLRRAHPAGHREHPDQRDTAVREPELITALACVKQAAAMANRDLGLLQEHKAGAIIAARQGLRAGRCHERFVVDVIQGGAGTSTTMNANEVIANLALERHGRTRSCRQRLSICPPPGQ